MLEEITRERGPTGFWGGGWGSLASPGCLSPSQPWVQGPPTPAPGSGVHCCLDEAQCPLPVNQYLPERAPGTEQVPGTLVHRFFPRSILHFVSVFSLSRMEGVPSCRQEAMEKSPCFSLKHLSLTTWCRVTLSVPRAVPVTHCLRAQATHSSSARMCLLPPVCSPEAQAGARRSGAS